jgi:AcrR family transcriptional regulator
MVEKKENTAIDKKEHIVNTAIELFADRGFEGTSMRDLAAAAEVNIAMINYYFGSKENLLNSIVEYRIGHAIDETEEIVKEKGLTSMEKIKKAIAKHIEYIRGNLKFNKVIFHEIMLSQRPETNKIFATLISKKGSIFIRLIEEGIKSGAFKQVDPQLTLFSIFGTVNQIYLSKTSCKIFINPKGNDEYDPNSDTQFQKRVSAYMNSLVDNLLLKK